MGQKVDLHPTPEHLATIREKGIGYEGALDLASGEYPVRNLYGQNRLLEARSSQLPYVRSTFHAR
jgi:hypothetical protein